jgi:hypothetical protein
MTNVMRRLVCGVGILLLGACAAPAHLPRPTISVPTATSLPATDVVQTLISQLRADEVVVVFVTLEGIPRTLTVAYQLNEQKIVAAQQDFEVSLVGESERSVHAITRRVIAQLDAGAGIDRVIMREQIGHLAPQPMLVQPADMRAWASGQIDDNAYHARWCCTPP